MLFSKTTFIAAALACISALTVEAHVSLKTPCPRHAPWCGAAPVGQSVDYDITSPIGVHDRIGAPLCKNRGVQTTRTVLKAGKNLKTEYQIGAAHGGGHCQWALSYDEGKTWVVFQTLIRDCLKGVPNGGKYSVNVKIPKDAPSGKAIFMWLWNNAIGNRELYSNCVDVVVRGKEGGKLKGLTPLIANYGPKSVHIGEFPNAGDNDGSAAFKKRKAITVTAPKK
ncbi:hypothetical protein BGZ65_000842 [Modicella reniformis]|uniref:Chitin-binding type-4 domain-containing protein n=1 Tax=Modicella reniformis TaxID=1440133 RepID=A0A9P6IPV5_9FUNG|nr:hypothetical protein BGZ65_000842 [Modicella reniformis]